MPKPMHRAYICFDIVTSRDVMCTCLFPENQVMVFQYINDATDKVPEKHPRMEANVWAKVYVEYMYTIHSKHVK